MELFNPNSNIPFMSWRKPAMIISVFFMVAAIATVAIRGLNFALDFTGGTLIEVSFEEPVDVGVVRGGLEQAGFTNLVVQSIGGAREVALRLPPEIDQGRGQEVVPLPDRVLAALAQVGLTGEIKRSEFVGPQVGEELSEDGVIAVLFVIVAIMLYVAIRFEWRFGLAAIAGEAHDVIITLGFISLMGISFDLTVLAGLLTVAGYSINDKVVVFDRVREIFRSARKLGPEETINKAVNNTLARTIMTGVTTMFALLSLYFLGGPVVEGFAATVIFGVIIGTLSTIFFCNPILLWLGVSKADLTVVKREDPELAMRP